VSSALQPTPGHSQTAKSLGKRQCDGPLPTYSSEDHLIKVQGVPYYKIGVGSDEEASSSSEESSGDSFDEMDFSSESEANERRLALINYDSIVFQITTQLLKLT